MLLHGLVGRGGGGGQPSGARLRHIRPLAFASSGLLGHQVRMCGDQWGGEGEAENEAPAILVRKRLDLGPGQ